MKKQPFKNLLLRFLRKCKLTYRTINGGVLITGRYLDGIHVVPDRTRVYLSNMKLRDDRLRLDILVEYSIQVFLYKLFKFGLITEVIYYELLTSWEK